MFANIEGKICILGFGREGKSLYNCLRKEKTQEKIIIADENLNVRNDEVLKDDNNLDFILGNDYLNKILEIKNEKITIIKSPGISLKNFPEILKKCKITSLSDLFLQKFSPQIIGITGTKGKSTTSSLIYHIIKKQSDNVVLVGNIGKAAFDYLDEINENTIIVFELSSHQLEFIEKSPHIAVLLNIFEEHLDHYLSYRDYQKSKWNIAAKQSSDDFLILNCDDNILKSWLKQYPPKSEIIKFGRQNLEKTLTVPKLKGEHNLYNITAAILACRLVGIDDKNIEAGLQDFEPLPHRLQFVGEFKGVKFYNDSISTIPQATIAALEAIQDVNTLILGGFDRGIDYEILVDYLSEKPVENVIFVGEAGKRIRNIWVKKMLDKPEMQNLSVSFFDAENYNEVVEIAYKHSTVGKSVLLSPAAASYDMFKNFEHRGNEFMKLVRT